MDKHKFKQNLEQLLIDLRDACAEESRHISKDGYFVNTAVYHKIMNIDVKTAVEQFTLEQFPNE